MVARILFSLCIASLQLLTACGRQESSKSQVDGHYEEATAALMQSYDQSQTAVAEFKESRGVIIALPLLTAYNKEQMALDILDSGIDTLWITVPVNFQDTLQSHQFAELRQLVGDKISRVKLIEQQSAGSISVWARDWAPLGAKAQDGSLRLIDFNYYPDRTADDSTARSMLNILPVHRVSVPVYNEGGNFMNNSLGVCMMSSRVTDANTLRHFDDDMILDNKQIIDYYRRFAGCSQTHIFPRMPFEGTGHIDMWAKFLNDNTVIVGEYRDELLSLPGFTEQQVEQVKTLQRYLNDRAAEISNLGFTVVRMPMPAPVFFSGSSMFRSYTNSLTLNKVALVPRYSVPANSHLSFNGQYIDQKLLASYEGEVINIYRRLGYGFKWVGSDDVIAAGGAVHCTTMQIAR